MWTCSALIFVTLTFLVGQFTCQPDYGERFLFTGTYQTPEMAQLRMRESRRIRSYMDTSISPCDNFYGYACGNFINSINDFQNETTSVFTRIAKKINEMTISLLSQPDDFTTSGAEMKAKAFYRSCIDSNIFKNQEDAREMLKSMGDFPLLNGNWSDENFHWIDLAIELHRTGLHSLVLEEVSRNPFRKENVIFVGPVEPRDINYEDIQSSNKAVIDNFKLRRQLIFQTIGIDETVAAKAAHDLLVFEAGRVNVFGKDYHSKEYDFVEMQLNEFKNLYPNTDWQKFFEGIIGRFVDDRQNIIIRFSKYLKPMLDYIKKSPKKVIANYLLFETLDSTMVSFTADDPNTITCSEEIEANLHQILAALYIRNNYDEEKKRDVNEITTYLRFSMENLIRNSKWLDDESRSEALKKLSSIRLLNGYIEKVVQPNWLEENFGDMPIYPDNFIRSIISVRRHVTRLKQSLLFKPTEELSNYYLNMYSFNAFYYFGVNDLAAPLGFQTPPVYHKFMPKAYNFGSIGSFLGHEMTHAFDNKGRKYDSLGNIRNWWSDASNAAFDKAAKCFIDAYSKYTFENETEVYLDAKNTLGENIADHGGVKESYYAYKKWLEYNRQYYTDSTETLPALGLNNMQLFFLSYAQFWCEHIEPFDYATSLRSEHSPGQFRVLGVLSNFEEFSKEFNCPLDSPMNPKKKCSVW